MGNIKIEGIENLEPKKLDPDDPKVKEIIDRSIKAQEEILKLKHVSLESLKAEITI